MYDEAGLLTADEIADLNDEIASFMEESGWNVYAVTTDDAQGKSATAYADDFFDEHSPDKEDGVALLIDMDNREITISTCGIAIRYLTDSRIDDILDLSLIHIFPGKWRKCLRLSEIRKRCAPSGAYLTVQCSGKETDLFCVLRCHAGY